MTALEVYELATHGGGTDFARVIEICQTAGAYCLIGGLAVNCYVEPVYALDVEIVMAPSSLAMLNDVLDWRSELRVQFTTDPRYEDFPSRSMAAEVLGVVARVAALEDVARGKLWAYSDPARRLSKRKKDELDLIRLAEAHPHLKEEYPLELRAMIERG